MPFADYEDMDDCIAKNEGKVDNPGAYCAAIHKKATGKWPSQKESRNPDFTRIYDGFRHYYGPEKCDSEYYSWIVAMGIDEAKSYAHCLERFSFAEQSLKLWREDASNKYYKVLVGFPIQSMNRNVYTEQELRDHASKLMDVELDLNHHKKMYGHRTDWVLRGARYEKAGYEDGATEAVLKVPKGLTASFDGDFKAQYPQYWGKAITDLIDSGEIVNQSLEADRNNADFFEGSALLTKDVLPGIPLSRIFPLESILTEAFNRGKVTRRKINVKVIIGGKEGKMTEKKKVNEGFANMPSGQLDDSAKTQAKKPPEATTGQSATMVIPDNSSIPVTGQIPATKDVEEANDRLERSTAIARATKAEMENMTLQEKVTYLEKQVTDLTAFQRKQLETVNADYEQKLGAENKARIEAEAQIRVFREQVKQGSEREDRLRNELKERERMLLAKDRVNEDVSNALNETKIDLEKLKSETDAICNPVTGKYRNVLNDNIELGRMLRSTQENYVSTANAKLSLEESLKKTKRLGKIIGKVKV